MQQVEVKRVFLGWNRPLVEQASKLLCGLQEGRLLDLRGVWLVLPTRQAIRLLRRGLMESLSRDGRSLLPPRMMTAQQFIGEGVRDKPVATSLEQTLAWMHVLQHVDLNCVRGLFPIDPATRNIGWAHSTAKSLIQLRTLLAEGGLDLADLAKRSDMEEPERWNSLSYLESEYRRHLHNHRRIDETDARREFVETPILPDGLHTVILVGHPDPMGLAVQALERMTGAISVEVWSYVDDSLQAGLDQWGRAVKGYWTAELALDPPTCHIHWLTDTEAQAKRALELNFNHRHAYDASAIASMEPELRYEMDAVASEFGVTIYHPDGLSVTGHDWLVCLRLWLKLMQHQRFAELSHWLRQPVALHALYASGLKFSDWRLRMELDEIQDRCLPYGLSDLKEALLRFPDRYMVLRAALEKVECWLNEIQGGQHFASSSESVFNSWWGRGQWSGKEGPVVRLLQDAMLGILAEMQESSLVAEYNHTELWSLLVERLESLRLPVANPGNAIEVSGWLELLWDQRPHVILAGCNEGNWPAMPVLDSFLPDSTRERLGLPCEAARLERDAYLLRCILESRRNRGRLDFLGSAFNRNGDVLRPSRLLLLSNEDSIAARVTELFHEPTPESIAPAWSVAWQYAAPDPVDHPVTHVNVTDFSDFLSCPWRHYLGRRVGMNSFEAGKRELNEADFGSIVHKVWELFLSDDAFAECAESSIVMAQLERRLEQVMRGRFGGDLSTPLLIQQENARERLRAAAPVWAAHRAEGWRRWVVEWRLHDQHPPMLNGLPVHGKIDLIERHKHTGALRVIDFKTRDKMVTPQEAHIISTGRQQLDFLPEAALLPGGKFRWADLQLPLYAWALREKQVWQGELLELGYFNLPTIISQTGFSLWEEYNRETADAALTCALAVAERMQHGVYWPPNPNLRWRDDPFVEWFPGDWHEVFLQKGEVS